MAKQKRVVADRVATFTDLLGGRHLITATAGPTLDPVVLSLGQTPDYRTETAHGSFPKHRAADHNPFRVHFRGGEEWCLFSIVTSNRG